MKIFMSDTDPSKVPPTPEAGDPDIVEKANINPMFKGLRLFRTYDELLLEIESGRIQNGYVYTLVHSANATSGAVLKEPSSIRRFRQIGWETQEVPNKPLVIEIDDAPETFEVPGKPNLASINPKTLVGTIKSSRDIFNSIKKLAQQNARIRGDGNTIPPIVLLVDQNFSVNHSAYPEGDGTRLVTELTSILSVEQ